MSKASTDKGKRGEREVVNVAKAHGIDAVRTAQLQARRDSDAADVLFRNFPALHVEVKRDERMSVDAMVRQAETAASEGHTPAVAWRRNDRPWYVAVPLPYLLDLLANVCLSAELVKELERRGIG